MAFLILLTFGASALLALAAARAAERHRRWTAVLVERRRRRVADALAALERDLYEASGELPPLRSLDDAPAYDGPAFEAPAPPRRILLRVKE